MLIGRGHTDPRHPRVEVRPPLGRRNGFRRKTPPCPMSRTSLQRIPITSAPPASVCSPPWQDTSRSSSATTARTGLRAIIAIHSTALGPALGGTRFYPYAASSRRARRRAQPLARHVLQGRARRPRPRRRQGRHHRRPGHADKTEALLRAYGRFVQSLGRPLLHRLRRRHLLARTWTSSPASATSSPAAPSRTAAPATPRCSRRTASSRACAPPPRSPGARRRWPAAPSASPASARSAGTWSGTCSRTAPTVVVTDVHAAGRRPRSAAEHPEVRAVADDRRAGRRAARRLRPLRAGRRAHRRGRRGADARRSSAAPPTTSSPTRASRSSSRSAASSTRPTTA